MDDQSIWKKEIHLRRRTADPRQATPPAADGEKESIWKREITFRKGDAQPEAADVAAVPEAPAIRVAAPAPVAPVNEVVPAPVAPVVPPVPQPQPQVHVQPPVAPQPVVLPESLAAAPPVAPAAPAVEPVPVVQPAPLAPPAVVPEPVVVEQTPPVVAEQPPFEPAAFSSAPAPGNDLPSWMAPPPPQPAEQAPAAWNQHPVEAPRAETLEITETAPVAEATPVEPPAPSWDSHATPVELPAPSWDSHATPVEPVAPSWDSHATPVEPPAPSWDSHATPVEPVAPSWDSHATPVEPIAPSWDSHATPVEPIAPSWDSHATPVEPVAPSWDSHATPVEPVAPSWDSHATPAEPPVWGTQSVPAEADESLDAEPDQFVSREEPVDAGQPEYGTPAELMAFGTQAEPADIPEQLVEDVTTPVSDASVFVSPPRAPWEDELDDEVESHGRGQVDGLLDEHEEWSHESQPTPDPKPAWEPEAPAGWGPVPPLTMSGLVAEVDGTEPAPVEPVADLPVEEPAFTVEPAVVEPVRSEPVPVEPLVADLVAELPVAAWQADDPVSEPAPVEPVAEEAQPVAPVHVPAPSPEPGHGTDLAKAAAAAVVAGAVAGAAVEAPKKSGLKRELRFPSRKEKDKSAKDKPKDKVKAKRKKADDQAPKEKKVKDKAASAADGSSIAGAKHAVKNVVGLRIGSSQLAAARIHNNGTAEVVQLARTPLARGIVSGGEVRDPEALTRSLKKFFTENKLPRRGVRLGIASNRIGVRVLEVPKVDDVKMFENSIRFHAQETLPIAVTDAIIDHVVLGESTSEAGETIVRVLLVFAHRELVENHLEACRKAGLKLDGVDLEAFALLRALAEPRREDTEATSAVVAVAVGQERTIFAVSDGRVCDFTRVLEWGGGAIDVAIARALDLTPSQAEPIKKRLSLDSDSAPSDMSPEEVEAATTAARGELQVLSRELVASLQFYQSRPASLDIGEILLSGGAAELGGFAAELEQLIGVPVKIGDPFARVVVGRKVTPPADLGSLAVAIGLGIED